MRLLNNPVPAVKGYNDKLYTFEKGKGWATFPIGKRSKKVFEDCLGEFFALPPAFVISLLEEIEPSMKR